MYNKQTDRQTDRQRERQQQQTMQSQTLVAQEQRCQICTEN